MNERLDKAWQNPKLAKCYMSTVRAAIPGALEQLQVMLRLIESLGRPLKSFLDLGCGGGTLGATVLEVYPDALAVFVDFSEAMIAEARTILGGPDNRYFLNIDYANPEWKKEAAEFGPYDAVVSGFSIHHQPDKRKREIYAEIFELLAPGGVFVNVEHVAPSSNLGRVLFDAHFIDSLYALEREQGGGRSREQIALEYTERPDKEANILAPIDAQCDWLRAIGYIDVDCHMKIYELAVIAAKKP